MSVEMEALGAHDDERLELIDAAFAYVPLGLYDEVTKLAEYALGEFISQRNALAQQIGRLQQERDDAQLALPKALKAWEKREDEFLDEIEALRRERDEAWGAAGEQFQAVGNLGVQLGRTEAQRDEAVAWLRTLRFCPECKYAMENHPTGCDLGMFLAEIEASHGV